MSEVNNELRAEWGRVGLEAFAKEVFFSPADRDLTDKDAFETALGDLLADLMHYANQQGWERGPNPTGEDIPQMFERLLERGRGHYEEELRDELEDEEEDGLDAPDCSQCGASNAGSREAPHLCETCRKENSDG